MARASRTVPKYSDDIKVKKDEKPSERCEIVDGYCRNMNETSFFGDSCEYDEPDLKCKTNSISLHIEALNHEKYSRLVQV